jgi:uncharacterized Tic20 family protein
MSNTFDSTSGAPSSEEKSMAVICHLVSLVATAACLNWLVPIIVMLISDSPFVKQQAKESLNFQISIIIWGVISFAACFIVIGIPMLFAVALAAIILPILAAIRVSDGQAYRYPLTMRLV